MRPSGRHVAALAFVASAAVGSPGCDAVLGYDQQYDALDRLTYCDCFSEQGNAVENRCRDGYDALVAGIGDDVTITTLSNLADQCSSCSDDPAVFVPCYAFLPDLKADGTPCGGPSECASLACCTGVDVQVGKPTEQADAVCCSACQGCGAQIDIEGSTICKGAATQAIAVIDEVPLAERNDACPTECALVGTKKGAGSCYNCLAEVGLLDDLCGDNPSRPVTQ